MSSPEDRTHTCHDRANAWRPRPASITMAQAVEWFVSSGVLYEAIAKGEIIPDFVLADAFGADVSAEALLDKGPLLLTFTLGAHSQQCRQSLHALQKVLPEIARFGARAVAITPDPPSASKSLGEQAGLTFDLLSDEDGHVAHLFGVAYQPPIPVEDWLWLLDVDHVMSWRPRYVPLPAAYVVTPDGMTAMAFLDADPLRRVAPHEIIDSLTALSTAPR
jgi:peroxiredoxin